MSYTRPRRSTVGQPCERADCVRPVTETGAVICRRCHAADAAKAETDAFLAEKVKAAATARPATRRKAVPKTKASGDDSTPPATTP